MTEQHVEDRDTPLGEAALVPLPPPGDLSLIMDPERSLADASRAARTLVKMVKEQGLSHRFGGRGGKEHLMIEAWQTIATWYGVTVSIDYCKEIGEAGLHPSGFEARAVAITPTGREVGAVSYCMKDEGNWKGRPAFQLASMAQTRACSKALRLCLGWVAVVAGYSATPAEEMEREAPRARQNDTASKAWPQPESAPGSSREGSAKVAQPLRDAPVGTSAPPMFGRNEFVQAYKDADRTIDNVKEALGGLDPREWLNEHPDGNYQAIWDLCKAAWGIE